MKAPLKACMLAGVALSTMALTEPEPIGGPSGDPRYRTAEWSDGIVIKAVASKGQTLMLEVEKGYAFGSIVASDQDIMDGRVVPPSDDGHANPRRQASEPVSPGNCTITPNLQTCIERERFLFFRPITDLAPQPVPIIVLKPREGKEPLEYVFMLELQTGEDHYYSVRVTMPKPVAAPRPIARRSRSAVNRAYVPPAQPPAVVNRAYSIEGDRTLLGEPGR